MAWQKMHSAPKDNPILLNVGLPWAVVGIWNPYDEKWVYADLQITMVDGDADPYFENEREALPTAWMPMPELEK